MEGSTMTRITHGFLILAAALLIVIALDSLENRIAAVETKVQPPNKTVLMFEPDQHQVQIAALHVSCQAIRGCR